VHRLNRPLNMSFTTAWQIEHFKKFNGNLIIQTMFIRGMLKDGIIDNTTDEEITAWIKALQVIKPKQVMIYTFERETPTKDLQKISLTELNEIAEKVRVTTGLKVSVFA